MARFRVSIASVFCCVLLLQTMLAPMHCLAHAIATGFEMVICTPDGDRSMRISAEGDVLPDAPAKPAFCAACHQLPSAPVLAVPVLPRPAWVATHASWQVTIAATLPPPARGPPFHPTGPPISLV